MSRILSILIGPELYWLLINGLVYFLGARNIPPTGAGNKMLLALHWQLPFLAIPLAFGFFFIPGIEKNWLFLRTNIACVLGLYYALTTGLEAHGEQGPGIGTAWIVGIMYGIFALVVANIAVKMAA